MFQKTLYFDKGGGFLLSNGIYTLLNKVFVNLKSENKTLLGFLEKKIVKIYISLFLNEIGGIARNFKV